MAGPLAVGAWAAGKVAARAGIKYVMASARVRGANFGWSSRGSGFVTTRRGYAAWNKKKGFRAAGRVKGRAIRIALSRKQLAGIGIAGSAFSAGRQAYKRKKRQRRYAPRRKR